VTGEAAIGSGEGGRLRLLRAIVLPEWVDYNGHMSEPYYVLIFGNATDAFYDHIGMDDATRRATATSIYTVEAHINYLREVRAGRSFTVVSREEKYQAKSLIDTFAYRGGDALSGSLYKAVTGGLGASPAAIGWLGAVISAAWTVLALALGRSFQQRSARAA